MRKSWYRSGPAKTGPEQISSEQSGDVTSAPVISKGRELLRNEPNVRWRHQILKFPIRNFQTRFVPTRNGQDIGMCERIIDRISALCIRMAPEGCRESLQPSSSGITRENSDCFSGCGELLQVPNDILQRLSCRPG
jgi:hypothetical protein